MPTVAPAEAGTAQSAGTATSRQMTVATSWLPAFMGNPNVLVNVDLVIRENAGALEFTICVDGNTLGDDAADLKGLFLDINETALSLLGVSLSTSGLKVHGSDVTAFAVSSKDDITKVGGDVNGSINVNGASSNTGEKAHGYEIGIRFGDPGASEGKLLTTTFTLASSDPSKALSLDLFSDEAFAVRLTSVGPEGSSLKLTGALPDGPDASNPTGPIIPTDPTGPTGPTNPTGPTGPTNPTGPTDLGKPSDLPGHSFDDLIEGGDGNDRIYGGRGDDEMQGEGGDDLIVGGTDDGHFVGGTNFKSIVIGDNLYGNSGHDTYLYNKADGVDLIWDFVPGEDQIVVTGYTQKEILGLRVGWVGAVDNRIDTPSHEKLVLVFSDGGAIVFNDYAGLRDNRDTAVTFVEAGSQQRYTLSIAQLLDLAPAQHDQTVSGAKSQDSQPAASATRSFHDVAGSNDADWLTGQSGDDRLYGNEGPNWLNGRAGNDELYGGNVRDVMLGGDGNDVLYSNGGDDFVVGGAGSDKLYGTGGADVIYGDDAGEAAPLSDGNDDWSDSDGLDWIDLGAGDDTYHYASGQDTILGGAGYDAVIASGIKNAKAVVADDGSIRIAGPNGKTIFTVKNVEQIEFLDKTLSFNADDPSFQIYRLYEATLGRKPDSDGLSGWVDALTEKHTSLSDIVSGFTNSQEFQAKYGSLSNEQFVKLLYNNVLGRDPDAGGTAYWVGALASGAQRSNIVLGFSESAELKTKSLVENPDGLQVQNQEAASIARLYFATLDRAPDMQGWAGWVSVLKGGASLDQIAGGFSHSTEFEAKYGALNDASFVNQLYHNVLGRDADAGGKAYWAGVLSHSSRESVIVGFSESSEFKIKVQSFLDDGLVL